MIKSLKTRAVRTLFCASAALALNSCATGPAPVLTAEDLLVAPYALEGGAPFDVEAMFAALPEWVSVSHSGARFDPGLGGVVIDGLTVALANAPDARLVADRAVMWGGDPAAVEAVFAGAASLTEMRALFDRLSVEGLRSEGLQWERGAEYASLSIGKLVIDGLSARSYALAAKEGEEAQKAAPLRHAAAVLRSFAYDGAAYSDFEFRISNNRGDNVEVSLAEAFARDYDAGALAYQRIRGFYALLEGGDAAPLVEVSGETREEPAQENPYAKILNAPPAETAAEMIRHPAAFLAQAAAAGATEYMLDYSETVGMDVGGGLSWLARWELPPITETELLDFGAQTMTGYVERWNGTPTVAIDRASSPAADFYWLVPSRYEIAYSGVTYDFDVMVAQMRDGMGAGFATEAAPQFNRIFEAMSALDLQRITADMDFAWGWNGETGDASLAMGGDAATLGATAFGASMGGPSLARWEALVKDDAPLPVAFGEVSLKRLSYSLTDKGVLDRAFEYAASQNNAGSGAELRQSVAALVRMTGAQAGAENPRFPDYAAAAADFLERGGALSLLASPAAPVTLLKLQTISQTAPQTLPDALDITLTHTD